MSDMKNTLEQLVLEKQQAQGMAQQLAALLTAIVAKTDKNDLRLTKTDLTVDEKLSLRIDPVGKGGVKLTVAEKDGSV